ncbi:2Fe-2S iron-sulfur cluster-binding protein [Marinobacter sp.]|uniref:2Fe-2S iron-sulfur cluster-binding protein n=1 Tax=Marinobacter sp. TaxID=50741 RepID=UPI0019BCA789|nr:2Fe-2S iron-sulfur cluster-binding protein [Marinobacter sp.]MBD3657562.1 2Fe-2S iron-sulfur cluster binding domain-containing protein [Marinobacter sp.]
MYTIEYHGRNYQCRADETILDAMLRQGVDFPFSCRKGSCHACVHVAEKGRLSADAQKGLDDHKKGEGCFLPCLCRPVDDMVIVPRRKTGASHTAPAAPASDHRFRSPDPEMWQALGEGSVLSAVLTDFYTRVYNDQRLAPFFHGVTRQRAIEKQFLFMRQKFTGEKVYFGDRPRNAHHWMVISNELFDYRESIMVDCLRRHGLPEHLVERWRDLENSFRSDIVKDEPWKRRIGDIELPVAGFDEITLDVGALCDSCGQEIDAGVTARYHLRLGTLYCPDCMDAAVA